MNKMRIASLAVAALVAAIAVDAGPAQAETTSALCGLSLQTTYTSAGQTWTGTDVWKTTAPMQSQSLGPLWDWPVDTIYGGDYGLFATSLTTGDIYRWNASGAGPWGSGSWTRIGAPGAEFAVTSNGLYGLTPDRSGVYRYTGTGAAWTRVGGPAAHIYGGGYGLVATQPTTGDLYHYVGASVGWKRIGAPGAEFAVSNSTVYGLTPDRSAVYRYTGTGAAWERVGGPAAHIYAGGPDTVLTESPTTHDIYRREATGWRKIGLPGKTFIITDSAQIYGLTPNSQSVWQYSGSGTTWTKVTRDTPIATIVPCS